MIAAALMIGGRSTRMGRDKTWLDFRGHPLWWHQWEKLRRLGCDRLFLSTRPGQDAPTLPPPAAVVPDAWPDAGPLGGILTCLDRLQLDGPGARLLVLGIDMPHLSVEFLEDLIYHSDPGCGAAARHGDRFEPLAAVYPVEMLDLGRRRVRLGHLSLQGFVDEGLERSLMLEMPAREWPREMFANLNTPADAQKWLR